MQIRNLGKAELGCGMGPLTGRSGWSWASRSGDRGGTRTKALEASQHLSSPGYGASRDSSSGLYLGWLGHSHSIEEPGQLNNCTESEASRVPATQTEGAWPLGPGLSISQTSLLMYSIEWT